MVLEDLKRNSLEKGMHKVRLKSFCNWVVKYVIVNEILEDTLYDRT